MYITKHQHLLYHKHAPAQQYTHLHKLCTDERLVQLDWRAAEDVARDDRQRDVLDHVGEQLEAAHVTQEVLLVVHHRQLLEDVLCDDDKRVACR